MAKRKKAARANEDPLKVLILYQYDHKDPKGRAKPEIIEAFQEELRTQKLIQGYRLEARTLVEWADNEPSRTFMDLFMLACRHFDLALAVHMHDARKACAAGNLWLEVGYWLGVRGPESLLIVQQEYGDKRDGEMAVPSDIGTSCPVPVVRVKNGGAICLALTKRIASWQETPVPPAPKDKEIAKIQAELVGTGAWRTTDFERCGRSGGSVVCEARKPSLAMIAELGRFVTAVREVTNVVERLHDIGLAASDLARTHAKEPHEFRAKLRAIQGACCELKDFVDGWPRQGVRSKPRKKWPWSRRLPEFILRRGFSDRSLVGEIAGGIEYVANRRLERIGAFRTGKPARLWKTDPKLAAHIDLIAEHVPNVIRALQGSIEGHFRDIGRRLTDGLGSPIEPTTLGDRLRECYAGFCHNGPQGLVIPRIWPEESRNG